MKSSKANSLHRLVSFILIAVLLLCTVGFAVGGWQSDTNNDPDSGEVGDNTDKTDENKDGKNNNSENNNNNNDNDNQTNDTTPPPSSDSSTEIPNTPKYYNKLTGLQISEDQVGKTPVGYVIDPDAPMYGISSADLSIEFPTETGKTRMISYTTNHSVLWKIGALVASRAFISSMSNFFGGVVVSYGNDDVVKYSAWDASKIHLDISSIKDCYYVENTLYIYTSRDMVSEALEGNLTLEKSDYKEAPFDFCPENESINGTTDAKILTIPYSENSKTELYYSEKTGNYLFFKSGSRRVDMLSGKNISFKNVFVLFANATTYEKADGTELVIDTISGGNGYYISDGKLIEIRWNISDSGSLEFTTLAGERLTVNRGNSYIGYFKASNASKVTFE